MDWLLDAFLDSLKLIPFLFFAYVLIELLETFASKKLSNTKFLKGKWAPAIGAAVGIVPQCGFSVVATDLYSSKKITVGTLIAIFTVTSDEAIPILLSNLSSTTAVVNLVALICLKFVVGLIAGYAVDFVVNYINKNAAKKMQKQTKDQPKTAEFDATTAATANLAATTSATTAPSCDDCCHNQEHNSEHSPNQKDAKEDLPRHKGCCGHDIEEDNIHPAKQYVLHPLIHTLKIFAYILVVNIIFGACINYLGEDKIANFLQSSLYFAPLLACIIGLIPNCASSVVLTNLLVIGGLNFSACIAGLIVNAGLAYIVLFKQNKNLKQNMAIVSTMFAIGIIVGYGLLLCGM